jgi:hypothetical protein
MRCRMGLAELFRNLQKPAIYLLQAGRSLTLMKGLRKSHGSNYHAVIAALGQTPMYAVWETAGSPRSVTITSRILDR